MSESTKKMLQETLARLRKIVLGINLRRELKAERQQEKDRERKLQKKLRFRQ